jgi:hypothetical protein
MCSWYLTYAKQNRDEWEKKGRELVASFKAKAVEGAEEKKSKAPSQMSDIADTDDSSGSFDTNESTEMSNMEAETVSLGKVVPQEGEEEDDDDSDADLLVFG